MNVVTAPLTDLWHTACLWGTCYSSAAGSVDIPHLDCPVPWSVEHTALSIVSYMYLNLPKYNSKLKDRGC